MNQIGKKLSDLFNVRSGKVTHVALGILTWLGTSQAIGFGLQMAGLPGGGFLIGGLIGSFAGWHNYQVMQLRQTSDTPLKNFGRNVGLTLCTAFGAVVAGATFSGGAMALPGLAALGLAAGAVQYLSLPKTARSPWSGGPRRTF